MQHRFTTCNNDMDQFGITLDILYLQDCPFDDLLRSQRFTGFDLFGVPCEPCVTPGASKIAVFQADEKRRMPGKPTFSLNGIEDLRDWQFAA